MPAVDTTAINAHNAAIAAYGPAAYRPLRKIGGGANDPLIVAAQNAANAALAASNAATVNPAQANALSVQMRHYNRAVKVVSAVLGVRRRRAMRVLTAASRALIALHQVNV